MKKFMFMAAALISSQMFSSMAKAEIYKIRAAQLILPHQEDLLDGAATSAIDSANGYIELTYLGQETLNTKKVKVDVTVNAAAIGLLMQKHVNTGEEEKSKFNLVFNIRNLSGKTVGDIFGYYSGAKIAAGISSTAVRAEALVNANTGIALTDAGAFDEFVIGAQLFQQDFAILERKDASTAITTVSTGEAKSESNTLSIDTAKALSTESIKD